MIRKQGISWMAHKFSHGMPMILGDQMGLGKTIQSIGFLAHLQVVTTPHFTPQHHLTVHPSFMLLYPLAPHHCASQLHLTVPLSYLQSDLILLQSQF